jgi:hypothetical protein
MRRGASTGVALGALALGLLLVVPAAASRDEYEVKAAFLLNFARLVEWPDPARPAPQQPVVVSVLGSAEVEQAISRGVGDSVVGDHPVVVKRISGAEEIGGSHILFVTREHAEAAAALAETARRHAALAVGESEGFASQGGVINFFTEDRKLRFEINPDAAKSAGLKISSRLLRLAVLVRPER